MISAEGKRNVIFCTPCACVLDKTLASYATPTNIAREFPGRSSHLVYSFQCFFIFAKYDVYPSVRKFEIHYQFVLYIYFHYICKEALTNGPLDEGGYELDLVGLEKSCPPPDKVSGKVAACGIGARPNCLCFPGKPSVFK